MTWEAKKASSNALLRSSAVAGEYSSEMLKPCIVCGFLDSICRRWLASLPRMASYLKCQPKKLLENTRLCEASPQTGHVICRQGKLGSFRQYFIKLFFTASESGYWRPGKQSFLLRCAQWDLPSANRYVSDLIFLIWRILLI
jgi:hypothetical protein